ncbi:MAG: amidohydrolase [Actinomycetales bacterium]
MTLSTRAVGVGVPSSVVLHRVRLVPVAGREPHPAAYAGTPVDLRIDDGVITGVDSSISAEGCDWEYDAEGRWAIPGLWDHHVHLGQWGQTLQRVSLAGTREPDDCLARVAAHVATLASSAPDSIVEGFGYRCALWQRPARTAELDAVSAGHPVVLISGDAHNGWLNSRAQQVLGVLAHDGLLRENEWFAVLSRLADLPGTQARHEAGYVEAVRQAARLGIVGVTDLEFAPNPRLWPARFAAGVTDIRVRCGVYPDQLDAVLAAGLRTGEPLDGDSRLTMGPLKIISDGSLNTRTAWCAQPYAHPDPDHPCGSANLDEAELDTLLAAAHRGGLQVAVHAIGDAALAQAVGSLERTGATGSIEHAQLVDRASTADLARLGVTASVQPAHLLDDRDVIDRCWPDRADRCFALADLTRAGVRVVLGSDAPVSPLDPWLAMASAVHRGQPSEPAWHPAQALTAAQALAASTDGQGTLGIGSLADIALLDADPLPRGTSAEIASALGTMRVSATFLAGRPTHLS